LKIGDSTKLIVSFSGTPPYSIVYSDGQNSVSVNNITENSYSVYLKPKTSTIYKLVSVNDKNTAGTVSGEFNVWVQPQFKFNQYNYSNINLTVGNIKDNINFRGNYYHLDDINSLFSFKSADGNTYQMSDHTYVFLIIIVMVI